MFVFPGVLSASAAIGKWSTQSISALHYRGAAYANLTNGKYFAVGSNAGANTSLYQYSTDGLTWSNGTLPTSAAWSDIGANATRIVVGNASNSGTVYYSTNGTTWTSASTTANNTTRIKFVNNLFFRLGGATSVHTSTDGASWTNRGTGPNQPRDVAFNGTDKYIVVGQFDATAKSGTTAFVWTDLTLPAIYTTIEYGNGIWVAMRGGTSYITSTNGTTWTTRTLPAGPTNNDWAKLVFFNSRFYYVAAGSKVYSSSDGISWTLEYTATISNFDQMTGLAGSPTDLLIFAGNQTQTNTTGYVRGLL